MITHVALPRQMEVGGGARREIGRVVARAGGSRPLLVTDRFLQGSGVADELMEVMSEAGLTPSMFADTVPDPTTDSLRAAMEQLQEHAADAIIGLGGGSPMDTAKALALLATQHGTMRDYKAPRTNDQPALPIIAVPTTAGSGSEVTQFTIITDSAADEKMLCSGPAFLPIAAILDHELTASMPPRLTADTGVDALSHAVEAYVSRKANPFTDGLCLQAIETIGTHLPRVYADGQDHEAREAMMVAATQAGIAFSNSSVALVHGMSRPIGAHFHIAHGMSNAMLFPAVTRFSLSSALGRYADCARALGCAQDSDEDEIGARRFADALVELCDALDVPTPQSTGIARTDWETTIPTMVEQAIASGSPANNPRVPTPDEISRLYSEIYSTGATA